MTSLYLGSTEIHLNTTNNTITGNRYFSYSGSPTIIETGGNTPTITYEAGNLQGTSSATIAATPQSSAYNAVTARRAYAPFNTPRGTSNTTTPWNQAFPDDHTFLGKTTDTSTGLVDIGARKYDPSTGRFISIDPVFQASNPQTIGGYAYAGNDPVSASDPTGLDPGGMNCVNSSGKPVQCTTSGAPGTSNTSCPPGYHDNGHGCGPDGPSGGSGGSCDSACQRALGALVGTNPAAAAKSRVIPGEGGNIDGILSGRLQDYILTIAGNQECTPGAGDMGMMAACGYLSGKVSTLTYEQLLALWYLGNAFSFKKKDIVFNGHDQLTQQLANDDHVTNKLAELQGLFAKSADPGSVDITKLGGRYDFKDAPNIGNLIWDVGGMASEGHAGHQVPTSFLGSYNMVYQVVSVSPKDRVFTVGFGAYNETGTASLTHAAPNMPSGFPGVSQFQEFYWAETVSY